MAGATTRVLIQSCTDICSSVFWKALIRTGTTMTIPHYINEDRSEMRGIKSGWYAMDTNGKLSLGPCSSREECLSRGTQPINESILSEFSSTA
jgi:hypothetical protein